MTIYDNTAAFGLMSPELQAEMQAHFKAGGEIKCYTSNGWELYAHPSFGAIAVYRAVKPSLKPDIVAWERLPAWANWVARDEDGEVYCIADKPTKGRLSFVCSFGCSPQVRRIDDFPGLVQIGTVPWDESLQQRPEERK